MFKVGDKIYSLCKSRNATHYVKYRMYGSIFIREQVVKKIKSHYIITNDEQVKQSDLNKYLTTPDEIVEEYFRLRVAKKEEEIEKLKDEIHYIKDYTLHPSNYEYSREVNKYNF